MFNTHDIIMFHHGGLTKTTMTTIHHRQQRVRTFLSRPVRAPCTVDNTPPGVTIWRSSCLYNGYPPHYADEDKHLHLIYTRSPHFFMLLPIQCRDGVADFTIKVECYIIQTIRISCSSCKQSPFFVKRTNDVRVNLSDIKPFRSSTMKINWRHTW